MMAFGFDVLSVQRAFEILMGRCCLKWNPDFAAVVQDDRCANGKIQPRVEADPADF